MTSTTSGAAVRITQLLRLFRSCFNNSMPLFCRMFSPHPSPERLILLCWHNLSVVRGGRRRSGSRSHREGRFPALRSSGSSLQQQSAQRPGGRSPISSQGTRAGGTRAPPYASSAPPALLFTTTPLPCCYGGSMEPLSVSIQAESCNCRLLREVSQVLLLGTAPIKPLSAM